MTGRAYSGADKRRPKPTARGGIQALDAALTVLRTLATISGPATLSDLSRASSMPASKVHRYLASFIHAGLAVQKERSGRYDLGPRAVEFGLAAIARNDFVNRTADRLEELATSTGLTALVTIWGDRGATVVRWEKSPSFTAASLGLGSTLPLLTSASGRIFLAFLPRRIVAPALKREIREASRSVSDFPDLSLSKSGIDALASRVHRDRLASVDGRYIPGLKALAAPVTNWQDEVEVAVTLIGTRDDMLKPGGAVEQALRSFTDQLSIPKQA